MEDALHAVRDRGGRTQLLHVRGRQVMSFTALHAWLSGRSREDLAPTYGLIMGGSGTVSDPPLMWTLHASEEERV